MEMADKYVCVKNGKRKSDGSPYSLFYKVCNGKDNSGEYLNQKAAQFVDGIIPVGTNKTGGFDFVD